MERASKESVAKQSTAEQVSGVSGTSEQTWRATKWPIKNAIVKSRNRLLEAEDPVIQPFIVQIVSIAVSKSDYHHLEYDFPRYPTFSRSLLKAISNTLLSGRYKL